MSEKMVLVDGNSLMHRAFHALPMMTSDDGAYTGALFGFLNMFLKTLEDERPQYAAVAFDMHEPTFRHLKYDEYKAGRAATPDELRAQMISIREILRDMHVAAVECPGFEADDILGTLSMRCEEAGIDALILTGDRDAFQLSGEHTTILYTRQGVKDLDRITPEYIKEKWGLTPKGLIDLKGLMGDSSDNIPGVPGVGEKTAVKLLAQYGTLDGVLSQADGISGKLGERIRENKEKAKFSQWLATIVRDAPVRESIGDLRLTTLKEALPALGRLQLNTAIKRIEKYEAEVHGKEAAPSPAPAPAAAAEYHVTEDRDAFFSALEGEKKDISLVWDEDRVSVSIPGTTLIMPLGGDLLGEGVTEDEAAQTVNRALALSSGCAAYDIKSLLHRGVKVPESAVDVMLAAYVIQPQRRSYSLRALCEEKHVPFDEAAPSAAIAGLWEAQRRQVEADGLTRVLFDVEIPLSFVLADMEEAGSYTDREALSALGDQFEERLGELIDRIHHIAGPEMNPNSPKQLSAYLFDTLGLKGGRKTKTGYSTDVDSLEAIQDQHPIIPLILEYRKYAKLKGTYIDALLRLRGADGRVHTSFDQVATATGRISSLEPNLQNIPVRTALGRDIRKAFCAEEGNVLVDADYSQIELRVLADLSGDERMQSAFRNGADIHAATAAEVYELPIEFVTSEMRSSAKAVNFGIVYGISDFGLAKNIGVSRAEAAGFIERYFARYPGVKAFMDRSVALGKAQGYVTTPLGRRRYLPELSDRSYSVRQFGERAAMNSPIQGAAADLIKLAMIKVWKELKEKGLQARLILQVHDELIVEAPAGEREQVEALMKECMEGVTKMSVPLVAEVKSGKSWYECK